MDFLGIKPFGSGDYVDLYEDDARTKIMRMLDMNTPLPRACSFCSGCSKVDWDNASIKVAEQITGSFTAKRNKYKNKNKRLKIRKLIMKS